MKYVKHITREMVRAAPDTLFVFGDNMVGAGYGGQAKELRGELNAVGIPTKWKPSMDEGAFFTDNDYTHVLPHLQRPYTWLCNHVLAGGEVVWPEDGIGTGYAQLLQRAPKIWAFVEVIRKDLEQLALHTTNDATRGRYAIDLIIKYGGIDGEHHKNWVLDQVMRVLAGDQYAKMVAEACVGEDGPNTYTWDCGTPP